NPAMKITRIETIYVRLPKVKIQCDSGQDALLVRVHTDAGITGLGEVDSSPMAVKGAIEAPYSHTVTSGLAHLLMGEDAFETEKLWYKMYSSNVYAGRRGIAIHAMSGIDMALWTSKAKHWEFQYGNSFAGASTRKFGVIQARWLVRIPKKRA